MRSTTWRTSFTIYAVILLGVFLSLFPSDGLNAQMFQYHTLFNEASIIAPSRYLGSGLSVYDVNQDGRDDITYPPDRNDLIIYLTKDDGFDAINLGYIDGEAKQPIFADYDNDGDPDLLLTVYNDSLRLYKNNGDLTFTDVAGELGLHLPVRESFGASWGDINNDGWLDLIVCNYDMGSNEGSWLFLNNEGVSFIEVSQSTGFNVQSDISFQSTIIDLNDDGKMDVHVANDRFPPDALLINYGDFFVNSFAQAGLDVNCNSMSSSFADFDHDLDMDLFVSNSDWGNFFWKRLEGLQYQNIAFEKNLEMMRECWGALWVDVNNDTWEDLYVNNFANGNDQEPFFLNISGNFERMNITNQNTGSIWTYGSAKGDFNNDGSYDIAVNAFDGNEHFYLINNQSENHYFKLKLEGVVSNRDGIGSWLNYFINGNEFVRFTMCGNSYLSQDSQWNILGMGAAEQIDSLIITWPSGQIDRYYELPRNSIQTFVEGQVPMVLFQSQSQFIVPGTEIIGCPNEVVELFTNFGQNVAWSNGDQGESTIVNESQWIYSSFVNELGITSYSDSVYVSIVPEPTYEISLNNPTCFGESNGSIEINIMDTAWVVQNVELSELSAGEYEIQFIHQSGCIFQSSYIIQEPSELTLEVSSENVSCSSFEDGTISVNNIEGGVGPYQVFISDSPAGSLTEELWSLSGLSEGEYIILVVDANGCETTQSVAIEEPESIVLSLVQEVENAPFFDLFISGGVPPYQIFLNNLLQPATALTLQQGVNTIHVIDANECFSQISYELVIVNVSEPIINTMSELSIHDVYKLSETNDWIVEVFNQIGQQINLGRLFERDNFNPSPIFVRLTSRQNNETITLKFLID